MGGKPFDESGYDIDHIQELRHGGTNDITNLQALCPPCHRVKTARNHSKPQEPVQAEVPVSKKIEPKYTTLKHIYKDVLISGRVIRIINKSEDPTN
jgi:5-methylcytosine-specific restriction endonuclease McrA